VDYIIIPRRRKRFLAHLTPRERGNITSSSAEHSCRSKPPSRSTLQQESATRHQLYSKIKEKLPRVDCHARLSWKRRLAPDSSVSTVIKLRAFSRGFSSSCSSSSPSSKMSRSPMRKRSHQGWNLSNEDRSQSLQSTPSRTRTNCFGSAALGSSVHRLVANGPDGDCGFLVVGPGRLRRALSVRRILKPDRTVAATDCPRLVPAWIGRSYF
jgi:hypothetical protein